MARIFTESFEAGHLLRFSATSGSFANTTASAIDGNRSGVATSGSASVDLTGVTEFFCGFFFNTQSTVSNSTFMRWANAGSTAVLGTLKINPATSFIEAYTGDGAVLVATGTHALVNNTTYHIQVRVKIDDAVGVITVKLDDTQELTFTGDTKPGADTTVSRYRWESSTIALFDSIVVNSTTGSTDNTYPGILRFRGLTATGPGFYVNNWSRNTGATNWEAVDEIPPDNDTTYIFTTTPNIYESFSMSDQSLLGANYKALITAVVAKKDSGTVQLAVGIRDNDNNTNYWGANTTLGVSYGVIEERRTVDPSTSSTWTSTGINSTEALIDSTTG